MHLEKTCPCGHLLWDVSPLLKPPAGTSHLLKLDIRGESSVIQPVLATPLIINWNRPNSYGQGNRTDQDTPSHSAPCYHRHHVHHFSWPCTVLKSSNTFLYPTSLPCRVDASNSQGRTGVLPNCFPSHFCWRTGTVLGHEDRAEKSSFLPAEGSGTHKPASKCVRLYCKREIHTVQTKPRVQNQNSSA